MFAAWWYLLRGKSQKHNVEGTTLFSHCLPHEPPINSPQTAEIQANFEPESKTSESLRSVLLNLDAEAVTKLNRVIRGTANYFATEFSTCRWRFQKLDSWIRMRLRCMKRKRKNYNDNGKLRVGYFRRKLKLLTLEEFCTYRDARGEARRVTPRMGQL